MQEMTAEIQLIEQLKYVGDRLLKPPSCTPELLDLLDEVGAVLSKVGQKPSESVKEALLPSMKALIADELLRNSVQDVKITVTACLNDIMRISAPVAPYDDEKMKDIFELIVSCFDNLSTLHGRNYSKAVLILENVAKLRSCVMMLDLDCDPLVTTMFELFLKNVRSDHPRSVLLAMETIMSVMIKESDAVPPELLKVLLASIRKENQDVSPASWKLGAKVIEECSEKLKPYIIKTVVSMGTSLEDYASILSIVCKDEHDTAKNLDDAQDVVSSKPSDNKSHSAEFVQALKAIECCRKKGVAGTDNKAIGDPGAKSGSTGSKKGRKQSNDNHNEGTENPSGKGMTSLESPHSHPKKSSTTSKSEEKTMLGGNLDSKGLSEKAIDLEHKQLHQDTPLGDSSKKKGRQSSSDASGGSRNKESTAGTSKRDKTQMSDASNSKSQRKRASIDDDVIETPYGRKSYKEDLVGCRIKVWWPLDRRYYEGFISSYDASTRKHKVDYDDGDEEIINLRKEHWEFLGDELAAHIDLLLDKRKSQPPSDGPPREGSTEGEEETSQTHSGEKGTTPESGVKSGDGTHETTKTVQKLRRSEVSSDTKRPRLSDGQKS